MQNSASNLDAAAKDPAAGTVTWHDRPPQAVLDELRAAPGGLSTEEATARLRRHGPNRLPEPPGRSAALRLLLQFHNILIYVLLAAAAITAGMRHWVDTLVILAVVFANAVIGFFQEGKAEKAMEALREMLAPSASVLRDGERRSVGGDTLVPGDIVLLEAGDKVPADLRLLQARGVQVQEAILTGESVPVEKQINAVESDSSLGDRTCLAFSGTLVTAGQARGVVVATGAATEIGRISGMLSRVESLTTPLVNQMGIFAKWLTIFILIVAAVLVLFGYFVGHHPFPELFMAVVGLSVAAIPEGLPAVLTITLAIGVQAMAHRNAIVRRLPAIETLGAVSVICTDKTGTLTRNEMMVTSIATANHLFTVDGNGYQPRGVIRLGDNGVHPRDHAHLEELALAAALCNDAALHEHEAAWKVEGDPMEGALLAFAAKAGIDVQESRLRWTRTDAIPFDARHRFMATLSHDHERHASVFVKGAPEQVMAMCASQRTANGGTEPLNRAHWHQQAEQIAARGQRVLAFAARPVEPSQTVLEHSDVQENLILLALVGLIDPPRSEAIEAVAQCHAAGIRVKMITGDHSGTAMAIARQIGLQHPDKVLTGAELDRIDDAALANAVLNTDVFARTSPEHKLRLVTALQLHGLTVATA
jgi:magnesium-transporting ATPase (P-type)